MSFRSAKQSLFDPEGVTLRPSKRGDEYSDAFGGNNTPT